MARWRWEAGTAASSSSVPAICSRRCAVAAPDTSQQMVSPASVDTSLNGDQVIFLQFLSVPILTF